MGANDPWGDPNWRLVTTLVGFLMIAAGFLIGPGDGTWSFRQVNPAGWTVVGVGAGVALVGTFARRRKRRRTNGKKG